MNSDTDAIDGELPERTRYLILLAGAPAIWMLHFLACYVTGAVWCARYAGFGGTLQPLQAAIVAYTAIAAAGIVFIGWGGYRRHRFGGEEPPHDFDSPADRHRFLGFATFLLAGLSLVGTIFSAGAALAFDVCY
jgi:hypothetical protein